MNETQTSVDRSVGDLVAGNVDNAVYGSLVPVIIEFCSPASGSSYIMSPCFEDLAQTYAERARFYRINLEIYPGAASRFDVSSIPCFVLVNGGVVTERLYGVKPKCEIEKKPLKFLQASKRGDQDNETN